MSSPEPWRKADVAQPIHGRAIKTPDSVVRAVERAKHPIFIVGHRNAYPDNEDKPYLDYVIRLAQTRDIPIVATAQTIKAFLEAGLTETAWSSAMEVVHRIIDPEWKGIDGKGPHDLVFMTGLPHEMTSLLLNALKHFTRIKTICVDRFYFPNASLAFPNLREKRWFQELNVLIDALAIKPSKAKPKAQPKTKSSTVKKPAVKKK